MNKFFKPVYSCFNSKSVKSVYKKWFNCFYYERKHLAHQEQRKWGDTVNQLKKVAPWFTILATVFFFYGFYLLMFTGDLLESVMFIAAFLAFIYASVIMDDEWVIKIGETEYSS